MLDSIMASTEGKEGYYHGLFKEIWVNSFRYLCFQLSWLQTLFLEKLSYSSFFAENVFQTMGHLEIILNFVAESYFCCWNTAKSLLKSLGTTCTFFLILATQHIVLQKPEKCCKWPLTLMKVRNIFPEEINPQWD